MRQIQYGGKFFNEKTAFSPSNHKPKDYLKKQKTKGEAERLNIIRKQ